MKIHWRPIDEHIRSKSILWAIREYRDQAFHQPEYTGLLQAKKAVLARQAVLVHGPSIIEPQGQYEVRAFPGFYGTEEYRLVYTDGTFEAIGAFVFDHIHEAQMHEMAVGAGDPFPTIDVHHVA